MAKKQNKKSKKRMSKRTQIILWVCIVAAVIAIAGIGYGLYAHNYNNRNHAQNMEENELFQLNYTLTVFGRNNNVIGSNDVLILDTMTKEMGGDTQITFVIYRYTNESDLNRALKMTAAEIAEDPSFEYMGNGTVTMVEDEIAGMRNMKATYIK